MKVDAPSSSKSGRIGELTRKHATYDIWSIGDDDTPVGGEEIKSISCLLPRKSKKGRLYPGKSFTKFFWTSNYIPFLSAPKPITRHIVFSAQEVKPTPEPDVDPTTTYKNPPRHSYPKEVLKHRFLPYGAYSKNHDEANAQEGEDTSKMDIDDVLDGPTPGQPRSPKKKRSKDTDENEVEPKGVEKRSKGKKRKGEVTEGGDTPATKKPKKSKAS